MTRPFTDRENFIVASTIMVVSNEMKKVSRDNRMSILQFIREEKYPGVTDQDWKEIANGIDAHKKDIFGIMVKAFHESSSNPATSSNKALATLDTDMKAEVDDIDFDELKNIVDSSDDPKLREYYLTMKQLKRDFDDDRKK
jgi:hypothetical protein